MEFDVIGENSSFQILHSAGQEKYRALAPYLIQGAKYALIVFNITKSVSFINVDGWIKYIQETGNLAITIIIGNIIDLRSNRQITIDEVDRFCNE